MELSDLNNIKGARNSKNRKAITELLFNEKEPVTADFVYEKLRKINPTISLSTVYRILEKLTINNITIKTLILNDNKARYEIRGHRHIHYLICQNCNKMIPTENCHFEKLENKEWKDTGFFVTGHRVEIYGYCATCKALRA